MPTNLKQIVQKRLLDDMIRRVQPSGRWKVLIVDPVSMKILTSVLNTFQILEENVTTIELISKKRQPYRQQEAIYFMAPLPESVNLFIQEFPGSMGQQMYKCAHMFFTSSLPQELFDKILKSSSRHLIKSFTELNLDFIPLEAQAFSVLSTQSFYRLYSPEVSRDDVQREIERIASKLSTFMATIGEYPYIRCYEGPKDTESQHGPKTPLLGAELHRQLETLVKNDSDFAALKESNTDRPTLLILDRMFDLTAPLIHEFTYQAMVNDLLDIDGSTYKFQLDGPNGPEDKEVVLDEEDHLWMELRHRHIAECINDITASFKKLTENKAAGADAGQKAGNLNDLRDVVTQLPQYMKEKDLHSAHISMAQDCMGLYSKLKIPDIAAVEQDIATGETQDGRPAKSVLGDLVPLLDEQEVQTMDKLRLLMLYLIDRGGLLQEDRTKLVAHAQIPPDMATAMTNLEFMGVPVTKEPGQKDRKKPKRKKKTNKGAEEFALSRHVINLRYVIDEFVDGVLDMKEYPFYGDQPNANGSGVPTGPKAPPSTLRGTKPSWQKKGTTTGSTSSKQELASRKGAKLFIFIVGGMTFSEIRNIYELSDTLNRDIFIGSTQTWAPRQMLSSLQGLTIRQDAWSDVDYGYNIGPSPIIEFTRPAPASNAPKSQRTAPAPTQAPTPAPAPQKPPKSPVKEEKPEKKKKKKLFF